MNFYKRHLGDIAKSCSDLSQGQMGAYDLLLDWHYSNEKLLPLAKDRLYLIGRARSRPERDNVDFVLGELFVWTAEGYSHKRAAEEMAKANAQAEANRQVAIDREAAKKAARTEHESCTNRQRSQTPDSRLQTKAEASNPTGYSSGDPDPCPHQEIVALYHEALPACQRVKTWEGARQTSLRARWREDAKRQSLDYWRRLFAHCAKSDFLMGRTNSPGRAPFVFTLAWLVKAENFAKVIEGNYHNVR